MEVDDDLWARRREERRLMTLTNRWLRRLIMYLLNAVVEERNQIFDEHCSSATASHVAVLMEAEEALRQEDMAGTKSEGTGGAPDEPHDCDASNV